MENTKKVDLRIIKTKAALRQALLELMETMPVEKITVSALTRQASVNRKTFYLHYTSIENMIESMIREGVDSVAEKVAGEYEASDLMEWCSSFSVCLLTSVHEIFGSKNDVIGRISLSSAFALLRDPIMGVAKHELERFGFDDLADAPLFSINVGYWVSAILGAYVEWRKVENELSFDEFCSYISRCTISGATAAYNLIQ